MKKPRLSEQLTIVVVGGSGTSLANAAGKVWQAAIVGTLGTTYDFIARHPFSNGKTFGTAGRTGLTDESTVNEEFTCITGTSVELHNVNTNSTFYICLFGDLG